MKKFALNLSLVLLALVASTGHAGQDPAQMTEEEKQAIAQKVYALMAPGEEHKMLEQLAGDWDVEMRMYPRPGAEPMTMNARGTAEMILGGRFLKVHSTIEGMGESLQILGFDRRHEHFTAVGFDTFGTYSVSAAGTYDEATKTITMHGTDEDPIMGHTQVYDFVLEFVDGDTWKFGVVFHDDSHGNEEPFKAVDITCRRAQS